VSQSTNAPPAFGSPTYNATPNATVGVSYSSTTAQDATDPESDPITYSRNGGTCGVWAAVAANGTISGTPVVGDVPNCTVIVRATATGGFDEATVTITVNDVTPFTDDTETWTGCNDAQLMSGTYYWTWGNAGNDGNTETSARNNWFCGNNATTSNSTGPYGTNNNTTAAWADSPYIYTEASSSAFQSGDHLYIQSPVLDGSSYDFSLSFDYAMDATLGTNTSLQIWVDNGTGTFTHHVTIQTGSDANGWTTNMTPVDLSQYNSSNLRIRIVVVIDGTGYQNDVTVDNIFLNGTP
jgi:hypothetical protein